jgi:hypothetical protein
MTATPTISATTTVTRTATASPTVTATPIATGTVTETVTVTPRFTDKTFAEVALASKIVTPYGSAFRTLRIYFKSSEPAESIHVRIFTLRNALVREVAIRNLSDRFVAEWDGRNNDNQVKQGIYIYQIEINGKVYNGAFVIAQ